ncbi:MAG: hypothetical protein ACK5H2_13010 [Beutenbergiaceae bacterium]
MVLVEVFGWTGSVLVVLSLLLANQLKFRLWNLIGSGIATTYNAIFGIWPFVAMNFAIVVIDAYWIWRLKRAPEGSPEPRPQLAD